MPKLTIITINFNNSQGLQKTMESLLQQSSRDFEYIVVDGASTDTSLQVISCQLSVISEEKSGEVIRNDISVKWISEPDNGIYHAMNKGIRMAKGDYVQFLNSGDVLAATDVTERMINKLENKEQRAKSKEQRNVSEEQINILYGNMLKPYKGKVINDRGFAGRVPTMLDFYRGTLNHSPAYIKRSLFDTYGLYDETLKIVSDYKWYVQVIAINGIVPVYVDIDVTIFDMSGISTLNSTLDRAERRKVLEELLPLSVLCDYEKYAFPIDQINRIKRYWITRNFFWLVERMLFKWEKF